MRRVLLSIALALATLSCLTPAQAASSAVRVIAVGDIAQSDGHQGPTAKLARYLDPSRILLLGDLAYPVGSRHCTGHCTSARRCPILSIVTPKNRTLVGRVGLEPTT